jgi:hypothetical protein
MPTYRLYRFHGGHRLPPFEYECVDDAGARKLAPLMMKRSASAELWLGDVLLETISAEPKAKRGR